MLNLEHKYNEGCIFRGDLDLLFADNKFRSSDMQLTDFCDSIGRSSQRCQVPGVAAGRFLRELQYRGQ